MAREGIGIRIARWRSIAGMTQEQLGVAIAPHLGRTITKSHISMIENGRRVVTKRDLLIAFARALRVSVTDLVGQPYPPQARVDLDAYAVVPAVRAALDDADDPHEPRPLHQLAFAADLAMAARMACDFPGLGAHLPGLLADTRNMFLHADRPDPQAGRLLVQAAVTGSLALKPAGWIDLATRLAELADRVARTLDDPVCAAAAQFALAQCALSAGARRRSYDLATSAAAAVGRRGGRVDGLAWYGMLHLHAALTAASLHHADTAEQHLREAQDAAGHVHGDPWRMECTPANVATWAVGVALENGEPDKAPELARKVDVNALHTKQRRSRLWLDTGRALYATEQYDGAVRAFLAADDAAPGDLRNRATAVDIVTSMVRAAPVRGGSEQLRDLAVRVGVDPDAPDPDV